MIPLHETLEDGAWAGEPCVVLGGGDSMSLIARNWRESDVGKEMRSIGVNKSLRMLPDLVFSMDYAFWRKAVVDPCWDNLRCPRVHLRVGNHKLPAEGPTHWVDAIGDDHRRAEWGTSLRTGIGSGWHSGFGAVNLADVLGASPIYLLGYDYSGGWWHEGYDHGPRSDDVYDRMLRSFGEVRTNINARIINCNPASRLRCFEFGDLP